MPKLISKSTYKYLIVFFIIFIITLFYAYGTIINPNPAKSYSFRVSNNSQEVTSWNSLEGMKRLNDSKYKGDFYHLASVFQPQINPLYCGIASSVIILNALRSNDEVKSDKKLQINRPESIGGGVSSFNSYSQITFLNNKTDKIKDRKIIEMTNSTKKDELDAGVGLAQLEEILEKAYDLEVERKHIGKFNKKELKEFREVLKDVLNDKGKFILVNFQGNVVGLKTGGHISPLAAYDEKSDSILVMDVAGHKNSWYFIKTKSLLKAMNSKDGNNYRGYLIISEN